MCIAAGEMLFESLGVPPVPRPILDRGIVIGGIFLPWLVRQALTYELVAPFNNFNWTDCHDWISRLSWTSG